MDPVPEAEAESQNYTVLVNSMDGATEPGGCATQTPTTCFQPSEVTINVGDSVTWVHNGPAWADRNYQLMGAFVNIDHYHCDGPGRVYHPETTSCPPTHPDNITGQSPPSSWTYTFNSSVDHHYTEWSLQYSAPNMATVRVWDSGAPSPSVPENALTDSTPPIIYLDPATVVSWPEHWYASNSTGLNISFGTVYYDFDDAGAPGIVLTRQCSPASNYLFPIGTTTVTCTATDAAENVGTMSFDVTVNAPLDTTPPVITVPPDQNFTAIDHADWDASQTSAGYDWEWISWPITAADDETVMGDFFNYDVGTCVNTSQDGTTSTINLQFWFTAVGVTFPVGINTVTCSATDDAGNTGSASFTVTVTGDTTPPQIWLNNQGCTNNSSEANNLCLGTNLNGYDNTTITRTALNSTGYNFYWHPRASDDVSTYASGIDILCTVNNVTVPSGTTNVNDYWSNWQYNHLFPIGTNQVTCTATDAAGNTSSASFTVNVVLEGAADTTPPVVTVPDNQYFILDSTTCEPFTASACLYSYDFPLSATDDVGVVIGPHDQCSTLELDMVDEDRNGMIWDLKRGSWAPGTSTTTCKAYDAAGNIGTGTFTVTVVLEGAADTTLPTVTATAYLNGTSPTGRTLQLIADDLAICPTFPCVEFGNDEGYFDQTKYVNSVIASFKMPDDSFFCPAADYGGYLCPYKLQFGVWGHPEDVEYFHSYFPIPEDWEAGSYDVVWKNSSPNGVNFDVVTPVTVPALQSDVAVEIVIPSWIKNNAEWWADDLIDDRSFVDGLQWLITNGIMNIPPTEQGAVSDSVIPDWIKQVAGWWAGNQIDDRNFVTGLQWLITNGIMIIG